MWIYNEEHELILSNLLCLDMSETRSSDPPRLMKCHGSGGSQQWTFGVSSLLRGDGEETGGAAGGAQQADSLCLVEGRSSWQRPARVTGASLPRSAVFLRVGFFSSRRITGCTRCQLDSACEWLTH